MNKILLIAFVGMILLVAGCARQADTQQETPAGEAATLGEGDQQISEADVADAENANETQELEMLINELG